jgi:hypothetical protein
MDLEYFPLPGASLSTYLDRYLSADICDGVGGSVTIARSISDEHEIRFILVRGLLSVTTLRTI